jgi:hypothetical protein
MKIIIMKGVGWEKGCSLFRFLLFLLLFHLLSFLDHFLVCLLIDSSEVDIEVDVIEVVRTHGLQVVLF